MTPSIFDMTGRVALVTGAASGMGRAMAIALAEVGADLMLADLNAEGVEQTAEVIRQLGRRVVAARYDISDIAQIRTMFEQLDAEFGRIDFLGNVAGEGALHEPETIPIETVGAGRNRRRGSGIGCRAPPAALARLPCMPKI